MPGIYYKAPPLSESSGGAFFCIIPIARRDSAACSFGVSPPPPVNADVQIDYPVDL